MTNFIIAYVVVWLGLSLYVMRLGAAQRRLARQIRGLELQRDASAEAARSGISPASSNERIAA